MAAAAALEAAVVHTVDLTHVDLVMLLPEVLLISVVVPCAQVDRM